MKTSRLHFSLCALALSCSCFVACGGSDDDSAGDSGTGGSSSGGSSADGGSTSGGSSSTGGASSGGSSTGGSSADGGSGSGGSENGPCPYPVISTWSAHGVEHHASNVFTIATGDVFSFNLIGCEDDDAVSFKFLPYPLVPGTYQLRWHLLGETGATDEVEPAANYITENDGDYATNADHTGELVITEVDDEAKTFSGTFHFEAIDALAGDDNVNTVSVTEGTLTDVSFE